MLEPRNRVSSTPLPLSTPSVVSIQKPKAIQLGALLDKTFVEEHSLIGSGLLNRGSVLIIGGPPKTYKSFVLKTLACHLATATPAFNAQRVLRTNEHEAVFYIPYPQKVLILEQEIGERDLQSRFTSLLTSFSSAERLLCREKIFTYSCDANMRLDTTEGRKLIDELIRETRPDIVCFDPFIEFHSIEENSSKEMSGVLHELDKLRQRLNFTTIITHHCGKLKEFGRGGAEKLRGSSVLHGKGDAFMMLETHGRANMGMLQADFQFRRGRPIAEMILALDPATLRVKFDRWKNAAKPSTESP